jgi:flagellar biosynthesis protein FlhA
LWIDPGQREQGIAFRYRVMEPAAVLSLNLTETVRRQADELLTRDAAKHLIDELKKTQPAVVDDLIPEQLKLGEVQRVLQILLREQVPIRQLGPILEALGDHAAHTKDPAALAEIVRRRLGRAICARHRAADGKLYVVTMDPELEDRLVTEISARSEGIAVRLPPQMIAAICRSIADGITQLTRVNHAPILLVAESIRPAVKQITIAQLPHLVVLSEAEIPRDVPVESVAMIHAAEITNWQLLQPAA